MTAKEEMRIESLMKNLHCTREEAVQIMIDDEEIDKGSKLFELTPEEKKVVKEMTSTGTKKKVANVKRERKPDDEKREIISFLANKLGMNEDFKVEIKNAEREISLIIGENDYSITLIKHRPPKN